MGNFEKLGILVIIVLVVVIIVVAAWGVKPGTQANRGDEASLVAQVDPRENDREEPPPVPDPDPDPDPDPIPDPVPVPPPTPTFRTHVVQPSEVLYTIAERYFGRGKGHLWRKIVEANPGVDPDRLQVGTKLKIPVISRSPRVPERPVPNAPGSARTYKVRPGDSLWVIAKRELDDPMRYKEILELNPDVNEGRLQLGQVLRMPAR